MEHIHGNGLMEPLQSVYKPGHRIEMAVLKVKTDILKAMEKKEVVCLALLDLSAAFDTVNHGILLNRLDKRFRV